MPVIKHLDGICHVYVDDQRRPRHGGAHRRQRQDAALRHLQHDGDAAGRTRHRARRSCRRSARSIAAKDVEMRGDAERARCAGSGAMHGDATEDDWYAEYLAPIIGDQASSTASTRRSTHINRYGSQHTDAIVTEDHAHARCASCARSIRLGDGQRLDALRRRLRIRPRRRDRHLDRQAARARPVGLEGLTSQKYVVLGHGEVRA